MRFILFLFYFLFSILLNTSLKAQESVLIKQQNIITTKFIGSDSYHNTYRVNEGVLIKTTTEEETFVFQDILLGNITKVDILNPLNLVVFFSDMKTIIFLDNKLSEIQRLNLLSFFPDMDISHISNAGNNRLWLFDDNTQRLLLFNYRTFKNKVFTQPIDGTVSGLISNFNLCYLATENYLYTYNVYGTLLSKKSIGSIKDFSLQENHLFVLKEGSIFLLEKDQIIPIVFLKEVYPIKNFYSSAEFLYLYNGKKLFTFLITKANN